MADLSAYISFAVEMDIRNKSLPVMVLTDNSVYPVGVDAGVSGIFEITQPDGGVYNGSWSSPDIVYSSGSLQPATIALRLATGMVLQPGVYTIKYTVDHSLYTPTVLTRTFTLAYTAPEQELTESFDVFTPALQYVDDTVYSAGGYTQSGLTRAWTAVVGTVGTVVGAASTLNLAYSGNYYDAEYDITLVSECLFTSTSYSYLSIREKLTANVVTDAYTPPSAAVLLGYLKTLKSRLDSLVDTCQRYDKAKADYEYAVVLYAHVKSRVCAGDTVNVYTYIQEILDILNYHSAISVSHTNTVIAAYNFSALCDTGGGGGGGSAIEALKYVADGTEPTFSSPVPYTTIDLSSLIGKTLLQLSVDGTIKNLKQGAAPMANLPAAGEAYFENAVGKVYLSDTVSYGQYILILYYA